jgi:hypothetical protein
MHVTSLEIILAVVAVFIVFGPKDLPRRKRQTEAVKLDRRERAPIVPRLPSQFAAGRAPSPLQVRSFDAPHQTREASADADRPQFAAGSGEGSLLPHELWGS